MAPSLRPRSSKTDTSASLPNPKRTRRPSKTVEIVPIEVPEPEIDPTTKFLDDPIDDAEASLLWPDRYKEPEIVVEVVTKKRKRRKTQKEIEEEEENKVILAKRHYRRAIVDDSEIYELNDDAHVEAGEGLDPYIGKVVEMFEGRDGKLYFTAQWFYKACDTVIKFMKVLVNDKQVFYSEVKNTNLLSSLVKKLNIPIIPLTENTEETIAAMGDGDYYCNMNYHLPYTTFEAVQPNATMSSSESSTISNDNGGVASTSSGITLSKKTDATLLDLYCGCGAMSTGLCMGAENAGLNLVTKWAVDVNKYACQTVEHNHPETTVRNESADDFLMAIKEWEKLCSHFSLINCLHSEEYETLYGMSSAEAGGVNAEEEDGKKVFGVEKVVGIWFGDPNKPKKAESKKSKKQNPKDLEDHDPEEIHEQDPEEIHEQDLKGPIEVKLEELEEEKPEVPDTRELHLLVRRKNYGSTNETWEPIKGLSHCREKIREFVVRGFESSILPLPGDVDVICGGPPCQGMSGFNRHRNVKAPLKDEKNKQLRVYMKIVEFLKPKYVLMENVVDILKFKDGYLGRYAMGRLIQMNYQTRMGMMAAGSYGLAQFRMRFFLWGVKCGERLPQFPLPTHDVMVRGFIPKDYEANLVAYDEGHTAKLEKKLLLGDIIDDLPAVGNDEKSDVRRYEKEPRTPFQKSMRSNKYGSSKMSKSKDLFDHHPFNLNKDDAERVCRVPRKKGACFRDFPGVIVRSNNVVQFDPNIPRVLLESGKQLVPDYAMSYEKGTSCKPFGRLSMDSTVPTVVTRPEPHNQIIIHPEQDRVLTIRENARLQGFLDNYKLFGPVKEKYILVGNAVAVPVARALGYSLGQAFQGFAIGNGPLFTLPKVFSNMEEDPESLECSC